jgi:outer membrane murein-binding lipoprotein Lpp
MRQGVLETCNKLSLTAVVLLVAAVSGCASITFFPKGTAQKAADKVIDDIWPGSTAPDTLIAKPATTPAVAATAPTEPVKSDVKK